MRPLNNHGGWVNPEDLPPMPQCIAQQDQSLWLSALTECTSKRCARHFGFICTHHQWWTELRCLSTSFSSEVVQEYLPFCGRSILAKAQLYLWIRGVIGREWLVEVGDTNGLRDLSPSSLRKGFSTIRTIDKAPKCLQTSASTLSVEPFQHVMASCSFTSIAQHTGNAARPWEYSERLNSVIALDSETANYDLTLHRIIDGEYFDTDCFCNSFRPNWERSSCSDAEGIDLTQERLWIHATCGSEYLPWNWTHALKTTEYSYIAATNWHWPACVADVPATIADRVTQCSSDACGLDSNGYCKITRGIDRTCLCNSISYDSCGGACHIFEMRIDYINWLRDLCGGVQGWHGLPDNWRQLSAPTYPEMIPWKWSIKSPGSHNAPSTCASSGTKFGSLVLLNAAPFLGVLFRRKAITRDIIRKLPWHRTQYNWLLAGVFLSALQLLLMCCNAFLIQMTPYYNNVPVVQLVLFWCTVPRITWLPMLLVKDLYATLSLLAADSVLQALSSYYMVFTVHYGLSHNFYFRDLDNIPNSGSVRLMYFGAMVWLFVYLVALVQIARSMSTVVDPVEREGPSPMKLRNISIHILPPILTALFHNHFAKSLKAERKGPLATERTSLWGQDTINNASYNTLPLPYNGNHGSSSDTNVELCVFVTSSMFALWGTQWLFWIGFVVLSIDEYCPPHLAGFTMMSVSAIMMAVAAATSTR